MKILESFLIKKNTRSSFNSTVCEHDQNLLTVLEKTNQNCTEMKIPIKKMLLTEQNILLILVTLGNKRRLLENSYVKNHWENHHYGQSLHDHNSKNKNKKQKQTCKKNI